jgi:hypothetical protein
MYSSWRGLTGFMSLEILRQIVAGKAHPGAGTSIAACSHQSASVPRHAIASGAWCR